MEVRPTPALPWSPGTERGAIHLSRPVSVQELIDGVLIWTITDYHGHDEQRPIERGQYSGLYLRDANGIDMYELEEFTGSSDTLHLTRVGGSPESLISVAFAPAVKFNPALPWNSETVGASITLNTPLSDEELANGMLRIVMQEIEGGSLSLCYVDVNDNKIFAASGDTVSEITTERNQSNKVKKINITSIDEYFPIKEISQGSEFPELLASLPLPVSGTVGLSCSKPISFDDVLAHVKIKISGSSEWLSANQRDQYGCDWQIDWNRRYSYTALNNNGTRIMTLIAASQLTELVAIKYEP